MARQSPRRRNAEQPEADLDAVPEVEDLDTDEADVTAADSADEDETAEADRALWATVRIDPIEVALPSGVGYTLRAYRLSNEITPTDIEGREEEDDPFAGRVQDPDVEDLDFLDEEFDELHPDAPGVRDDAAVDDDEALEDDADADEDAEEEPEPEEVPIFLSHKGRLLLFKSPQSLVTFVRSGAPHDLAQLDTWAEVAERIQPDDVSAADEDTYELDLVVENLRGGHDAWDFPLLINAGEIARDISHALRLQPVITALAAGSPLDDLDEALRAAVSGGFAGFRGRRRLRRIGAQQASLGWRTIIGKISAAVDWRD